jgi:hypothetical protein
VKDAQNCSISNQSQLEHHISTYCWRCSPWCSSRWRLARDDKAENAGRRLASCQGQEICASALGEAKAPTFSVAFSPSLFKHPPSTLVLSIIAQLATLHSRFLHLLHSHVCRFHSTLLLLRFPIFDSGHYWNFAQCLTEADTAAVAMVDAAAVTGTNTAVRETDHPIITITRANTHRTGRTISPKHGNRHQFRGFWIPLPPATFLCSSSSACRLSSTTALASLAVVGQAGGHVLAAIA